MQSNPVTPFSNLPWLRWLDRSELPAPVIGIAALLTFLPFYDFAYMPPRMPLGAGAFPLALSLYLLFLIYLARGGARDLATLVKADKIEADLLIALGPSRTMGRVELMIGLVLGCERVLSQVSYAHGGLSTFLATPNGLTVDFCAVTLCIIIYTILQIHLLFYCIRQVSVFNGIAKTFPIDLLTPDYHNVMSNPLIRFVLVAFVGGAIVLLVYEVIPYASMQRRIIAAGYMSGVFWFFLVVASTIPLVTLKSRISVAKKEELDRVRRAIKGDREGLASSQVGNQLSLFSLPDLLYYEDKIKAIWDWPFEAQVRRLVIFGLIPPITWILAALVEVSFESFVFR